MQTQVRGWGLQRAALALRRHGSCHGKRCQRQVDPSIQDCCAFAVPQAAEPSDPDTKALAHQLWRLPFHDRTQILNSAFYATPRGQATLALPGGDPREEAACFSPE